MQIPAPSPPDHHFYNRFACFELLAEAARDWDLDFKQIDAGDSDSELLQIHCGSIAYSRATFSRAYYQQVAAPEGMSTFAFFGRQTTKLRWCGHDISTDAMVRFPLSREMEAITEAGVEIHTLSISDEYLENFAGRCAECSRRHPQDSVEQGIMPSVSQLYRLRSVAACILREIRSTGDNPRQSDRLEVLVQEMVGSVLDITSCDVSVPRRPPHGLRQSAFRKAIDYLYSNGERVVRLPELCEAAGAAERTLEYAFRENVGIPPKSFMNRWRLCGVRKLLLSDDHADSGITTLAGQWGFWHMGQFARDYHRHFGELPSATLKRARHSH